MTHPPANDDDDETLSAISMSRPRHPTESVAAIPPSALGQTLSEPAWLQRAVPPAASSSPSEPGPRPSERVGPPSLSDPLPPPQLPRPPDPLAEQRGHEREARRPPLPKPRPAPSARSVRGHVTDLLWFDDDALPAVRRVPAWRKLLREAERAAPDAELDDVGPNDDPAAVDDRRDVFDVLARGVPMDVAETSEALHGAIRSDGKFVPPLVLTEGRLTCPLDPRARLEAEMALVAPLAMNDERLQEELQLIRGFMTAGDLLAPNMVAMLSGRLWSSFAQTRRMVSSEMLQRQADDVVRRKRRYQQRELFGDDYLRGRLTDDREDETIIYLPKAIAKRLPLFAELRVRLIGRLHMRLDPEESVETALQVFALARRPIVPSRKPVSREHH